MKLLTTWGDYLPEKIKKVSFFEWHSWDFAQVFVIWSSCKIVIRNMTQETASKIPTHPGSSFRSWVSLTDAGSKHCTPCPGVAEWSSAQPLGSPSISRNMSGKTSGRCQHVSTVRVCCESPWGNGCGGLPLQNCSFQAVLALPPLDEICRSWAWAPLPSELWVLLFCMASQILYL